MNLEEAFSPLVIDISVLVACGIAAVCGGLEGCVRCWKFLSDGQSFAENKVW